MRCKRCKMDLKYDPINLFLDDYEYDNWFDEESDDTTPIECSNYTN